MCQFCVEHGDGKKWYLEASNYAFDLESDLRRRGYIVEFLSGFDTMRARAIGGMEFLGMLPGPLERTGKRIASKRMRGVHFGQPVPIEECAQIFDIATSIVRIPCVCRMWAKPNKPAEEVCVLVTTQPMEPLLEEGFRSYDSGPDTSDFQRLSKSEALQLLRACEERGLMHSVWTFITPFIGAICNCDRESGCMAMRLTGEYSMPLMWRGESVAQLDAGACSNCRECVELCPFDAIAPNGPGGPVRLRQEACWGCGVCRSACSSAAISLVDRRSVPAVANLW